MRAAEFDLIIAAMSRFIQSAAGTLAMGANCTPVECDLASAEGVEKLASVIAAAAAPSTRYRNAGRGLGKAFLDQDLDEALKVVHTNIDGTIA